MLLKKQTGRKRQNFWSPPFKPLSRPDFETSATEVMLEEQLTRIPPA